MPQITIDGVPATAVVAAGGNLLGEGPAQSRAGRHAGDPATAGAEPRMAGSPPNFPVQCL